MSTAILCPPGQYVMVNGVKYLAEEYRKPLPIEEEYWRDGNCIKTCWRGDASFYLRARDSRNIVHEWSWTGEDTMKVEFVV